jgi:hypothetical protein
MVVQQLLSALPADTNTPQQQAPCVLVLWYSDGFVYCAVEQLCREVNVTLQQLPAACLQG